MSSRDRKRLPSNKLPSRRASAGITTSATMSRRGSRSREGGQVRVLTSGTGGHLRRADRLGRPDGPVRADVGRLQLQTRAHVEPAKRGGHTQPDNWWNGPSPTMRSGLIWGVTQVHHGHASRALGPTGEGGLGDNRLKYEREVNTGCVGRGGGRDGRPWDVPSVPGEHDLRPPLCRLGDPQREAPRHRPEVLEARPGDGPSSDPLERPDLRPNGQPPLQPRKGPPFLVLQPARPGGLGLQVHRRLRALQGPRVVVAHGALHLRQDSPGGTPPLELAEAKQ